MHKSSMSGSRLGHKRFRPETTYNGAALQQAISIPDGPFWLRLVCGRWSSSAVLTSHCCLVVLQSIITRGCPTDIANFIYSNRKYARALDRDTCRRNAVYTFEQLNFRHTLMLISTLNSQNKHECYSLAFIFPLSSHSLLALSDVIRILFIAYYRFSIFTRVSRHFILIKASTTKA